MERRGGAARRVESADGGQTAQRRLHGPGENERRVRGMLALCVYRAVKTEGVEKCHVSPQLVCLRHLRKIISILTSSYVVV